MATKFADVPAWPEPKSSPPPAGHNRPPLDELIPAEFREELLREQPEFLLRLDDLIGSASRAQATNDDELGRCGNLVNAYRKALAHVGNVHKVVKQPYLDGGRLVDAEKNVLVERIEAAKRKVEHIGDVYVADKRAKEEAERKRIEAEQRAAAIEAARAEQAARDAEEAAARAAADATTDAEREAAQADAARKQAEAEEAMAAAALAAAAPTKAEPVRSDEGATVSGKQEWKSEVTDYEVAFMAVADDEKVREAIDKAIARRVKAGSRKIEGVRVWPVAKANFR